MNLPESPEDISAPYIESILSNFPGETYQEYLPITDFHVQRLQKGTSGSKLNVITVIQAADREPIRFILKIEGGQKEVLFYRELADRVPVDTPRVLDARMLDDGRAWLIMEEITDVKDGLSWDAADYKGVLSGMARLHAKFWSHTGSLDDCTWLWRPDEQSLQKLVEARKSDIEALAASDLPRTLPEVFSSERLALAMQVLEQPAIVFDPLLAAGTTLVHGDYWFHNVQITNSGRIVLVDWQGPQVWSGLWELVYFLNLLLPVSAAVYREALPVDEGTMISWYADALAEAGVALPKRDFENALLAARVWHPIQHWIRQYAYAVREGLLRADKLRDEYPGAVRFLTSTFARWDKDAHALPGRE